jgi:hypothetical protein
METTATVQAAEDTARAARRAWVQAEPGTPAEQQALAAVSAANKALAAARAAA